MSTETSAEKEDQQMERLKEQLVQMQDCLEQAEKSLTMAQKIVYEEAVVSGYDSLQATIGRLEGIRVSIREAGNTLRYELRSRSAEH